MYKRQGGRGIDEEVLFRYFSRPCFSRMGIMPLYKKLDMVSAELSVEEVRSLRTEGTESGLLIAVTKLPGTASP